MEESNHLSKKIILIIYILMVAIISVTLFLIYSEDENNDLIDDENTILINIQENDIDYHLYNNKIVINTFNVTYVNDDFNLYFEAKTDDNELIDEEVNITEMYQINLYDENDNLVGTYDGHVLESLKLYSLLTCSLVGKYHGSKIKNIEIIQINNP